MGDLIKFENSNFDWNALSFAAIVINYPSISFAL